MKKNYKDGSCENAEIPSHEEEPKEHQKYL
jgi:hypothetical protein